MRPPPTFRPPTYDDLLAVSDRMRPADAEECRIITGGMTPRDAVLESARVSDYVTAGYLADELYCVFGIRTISVPNRAAMIWMLGTSSIERRPTAFIRHSRSGLLLCAAAVPWADTMSNVIHAAHVQSIRWLTWLGAEFGGGFNVQDPASGEPETFYPFTIYRRQLCGE